MKGTNVEGRAMDSIFMSKYPIEQFIPQKENTDDNNEKTIAAMEGTSDCVQQCTQRELIIDPDAGANAGSSTEIAFATNNPLSELVWSPRNGLSLKYTDCCLNEKKSSLFWSSEPGYMIISSPTNIKAWENHNDGSIAVGDSRLTQLAPNPNGFRSHKSTEDMMPPSRPETHEPNMRFHGDMEPSTTMNVSALAVNRDEDYRSPEKDMAICSPTDDQMNVDVCKVRMGATAALPKKASLPVPENTNYSAALSVKPEDVEVDLLPIEPQCGESAKETGFARSERSGDIARGSMHRACLADALVSEASTVKQYYLPGSSVPISRSLGRKNAEADLIAEESNRNKIDKNPKLIEIACTDKLESTSENDMQRSRIEGVFCSQYYPSKSEAVGASVCAGTGMIAAYHVEGEGNKSTDENPEVSPMDNKASPNNSGRKGKEKAIASSTEVDRIISNGKDDSQESVESCNSRELFSNGKRTRSFEQMLVVGSKRIKKQRDETPHSASILGKESSFMNWISNMVKRSPPKFYMEGESPLAIAARSYQRSGSHNSPPTSLEKNKEDPRFSSMGFQNVLQSLYCKGMQLQDKKNGVPGDQEGPKCSKELEVAKKIPFDVSLPEEPAKETVKFPNFIPILSERPQVGLCPSIRPMIASASDTILVEKPVSNFGENHNSHSIACGLETGVMHSRESSLRDDSGPLPAPEDKGIRQIVPVDPDTSSDLVTNKSKPLGSLWITRFSPKVSAPITNSQLDQVAGAATERFANCNSLFPQSQNAIVSVEDQKILKFGHEPSTADDHMNARSINVKNNSAGPSVSGGLKRKSIHTDQKLKSKVSPVLPNQRFKISDAMYSSLARRLDALGPLKVADSTAHADNLCYFCGIRGHSLKDCSWVIDSEIKDLLKNLNLYDAAEETTCLCIKCFEHSHWAISCPNVSSRKQINTQGNTYLAGDRNCDRIPHIPRNMLLSEIINGKHQLVGAYTNSHGGSSIAKTEMEMMLRTNIGSKLNRAVVLNGWVLDSKPMKKDLPRDDCHEGLPGKATYEELLTMGKSTTESFGSGSKESQITPSHDHVSRQIPDIPEGTFEAIRKLRLSRTEIFKWSKSPISNLTLEGYFVRVRLGKWEEGLGGTGYHMARIIGASKERPCVSCKFPISVDIGGVKFLVGCRYASNHDFIEDELMAWWCATLRSDGRLPSEEDLRLKLTERRKYGF